MVEINSLTPDHKETIITIILAKCKKINLEHPELFDVKLVKTFLDNNLNEILSNRSGYGLFQKGKLVSFLLGYSSIPNLKGKERGAYIPIWGHYCSEENKKHFLQLYQKIAGDWLKNKVYTQLLTYFPNNKILEEQLYNLGFGLLVIDAFRSMNKISCKPLDKQFTVRSMISDDLEKIKNVDDNFHSYMNASPTFLHHNSRVQALSLTDFVDETNQTIVIETKGNIVAAIRGVFGSSNLDLLSYPKNVGINYAFTDLAYRGFGLGTHLLNEILKWGETKQASLCTVDFESANLLANRFWLTHFKPISFSAMRKIDNRL